MPVIMKLVLLLGNTSYIILVNLIQMQMYLDDWHSASVRQEV